MDEGAAVVLAATDRLLGDLADAVPALRAVGDALTVVADGLGVERVIVAVDDERLGRQVFCSGRAFLGDDGVGLSGPAGAWTCPERPLDAIAMLMLVRAVGIGIVRSDRRTRAVPATGPDAGATAPAAPAVPEAPARGGLTDAVAAATARAARHGWGFTLVLIRGGDGLAAALRERLRGADELVAVSGSEVALLLPETAGDRVPQVLARLAAGRDLAPFTYGLACCPADGSDPVELSRTATERLDEALRATTTG